MTETPPAGNAPAFRAPAEWDPQEAVWLSWPLNPSLWPDRRERIETWFAGFARVLSRHVLVRINAAPEAHPGIRARLQKAGVDDALAELWPVATDDAWCRDHGPVFVADQTTGHLVALSFRYNAWGGKFPPWDRDAAAARAIAGLLGIPCRAVPLFCEGGALEVDGRGQLITTESVLLNPNRNPGLSRQEIEDLLRDALGVHRICWLRGGLHDDDTDGHIDTLTRFFPPRGILTVLPEDPAHPDHGQLHENAARLRSFFPDHDIRALPLPAPIRVGAWRQETLPATYANYLVTNGAVLVPAYGQPGPDARALEVVASCFPDRLVEAVDSSDVILEGGSLHCLTQQQPLPAPR